MGHDRNRVDPASQSDRTGLQQRSQHVKHNWRSCLAQVGRKIAAFERSRRDRSHLLSAFPSERGWQLALWFSVILNVNLAILNMLPIPVLDGGHIVLAIIESIRRRPVNMRVLEVVQTSCAVVIIGYMLYITFFDVQDLPF